MTTTTTTINIDEIARTTIDVMRNVFDEREMFASSRVVEYKYDHRMNIHICVVAITLHNVTRLHHIEHLRDVMHEICCNDDMRDVMSFNVNEIEFMIGDGDDTHACELIVIDDRLYLNVWVRALNN
jgi:hypothetical protein